MHLTYEEIFESLALISQWFVGKVLSFVSVFSKVPFISFSLFVLFAVPSLLILFDFILRLSDESFVGFSVSFKKRIKSKFSKNEEVERKQFNKSKHRSVYTPQYVSYLKSFQSDFNRDTHYKSRNSNLDIEKD